MDVKGLYTRTPQPYDTEFLEGSERKEINAWGTFLNYWKEKYPNLKIRASSEDICSECHIVAIRYKYKTFRDLTRDGSVSFSPDSAELLNAIRADSTAYEDNDDADANDVALLKVALENVVAAKAQGELHRRKTMNRQQLLQLFRLYHGSSKCIRIPATIARMRACHKWEPTSQVRPTTTPLSLFQFLELRNQILAMKMTIFMRTCTTVRRQRRGRTTCVR